jgi:Tfp pilus assembly protein PilF
LTVLSKPFGGDVLMDEPEFQDLIAQAFTALGQEDYVRAVGIADQLAAAAPERAVVRAVRAQALLGSNSPEESFHEARRAVDLDAADSFAQQLLAMTAWRTGRLTLAQQSFQTAVKLSGRRPALLGEYAWFMATERGPRLAEEAARAAIEADGESSTAWAALGLTQFRLHRRPDAEASLRRALQLNPNDLYAQSAMVAVLQDRRDDAKAEALAGLLAEHAGAEDLLVGVREEAKRRQLGRMLVERKVDLNQLIDEPKTYRWFWLLIASGLISMLVYLISPWCSAAVIALTFIVLIVMRRWLD